MKKMFNKKGWIFVLAVMLIQIGHAQTPVYKNSHYLYHAATTPLSNGTVTSGQVTGTTAPGSPIGMPYSSVVDLPAPLAIPTRKINKAWFSIKANTGNEYLYGVQTGNLMFKYKLSFQLDVLDNNGNVLSTPQVFENLVYELNLENKKPEAAWVKDITPFASVNHAGMNADFSFKKIRISNVVLIPEVVADPSNSNYASLLARIANDIRFELDYDIEYGLDVTSVVSKPVISSLSYPVLAQKRQVFTWSNGGYEYPNYEFQLLRLYNINASNIASDRDIITNIDWSKALRIETQSSATTMTLNIAEGTGYYVWRVRPIGTYYIGGIANHLNYSAGSWSDDLLSLTNINLKINTSTLTIDGYSGASANPYFFFQDPDDQVNWIYSRKFTEENKMSESITYATPGQNIRQVQSYLPSKDTTLVTQTVVDKTGRPSLSTLPVPATGSIQKYKPQFVTKGNTNILYKDSDYDTTTNYRNPEKVNQGNTSNYKYYSDINPDKTIPDAQGYPFQRTLYYNDGSGRVLEQSGVGKTHMIGDGVTGGDGKTVKTLYGTASETELISLFGDEAPDHEGVMKTITIDQNGTASVTFTSKEGKVIATGLSYQLDDNLETFDVLEGEQTAANALKTVDDKITRNLKTDWGFMSTKRLAFTYPTTLDLDYKVKCQLLEANCFNVGLDCKYKVQIIIHNVENPAASVILPERDLSGSCTGYKTATWPQQTLDPGTYIIEKRLTTSNPQVVIQDAEEKAEKQIMPLINMVTGKLKAVDCEKELDDFYCWLEQLTYDVYYAYSHTGEAPLPVTCDLSYQPLSGNPGLVEQRYGLPNGFLQPDHVLTIVRAAGVPVNLRVQSPCCDLTVSVKWVPPFRCPATFGQTDKNVNSKYEVNPNFFTDTAATEFYPDYEGYMMSILKECIIERSPVLKNAWANNPSGFNAIYKDVFYGIAPYDYQTINDANGDAHVNGLKFTFMAGWENEGDFNWMAYNMLSNSYDCRNQFEVANGLGGTNGNPVLPGQSSPEYDDCGNPLSANSTISCDGNGNCTQYKCSDLSNCLTALAAKMSNLFCDNESFTIDNPMRPSDKADEQSTSDPKQKTHDDHFNNNFDDANLSKRKKKKLAKKVSQMMRELQYLQSQPFTYDGHFVSEFLGCTGYKFAKILTPADPAPSITADINPDLIGNSNTSVNYVVPYTATHNYKDPLRYSPDNSWGEGAVLYKVDANAGMYVPDKKLKETFPKIKDPHFAFKYFEYEEDQRDIELLTCYSDPNNCKDGSGNLVPCCMKPGAGNPFEFCDIRNDVGNRNWDGGANGTISYSDPLDVNYVVKNFCGRGQVTCPYTHEMWSCGQRNSFYEMIKNLKKPEDFEEPASFTTETCDLYTLPNSGSDPDLVWTADETSAWASYKRPTDNTDINTVSIVTFEMRKMEFRCNSRCAERRGEFRDSLVQILQQRCYQIGGCKISADDNIILESDIDAIVDAIIAKCSTQCPINTYNCLGPVECRDANAAITWLGPTRSDIEILYGVDGTGNDCERKKWKQVMQWSFEVDIPSKCSQNAGYMDFTCTEDPDLCTTPSTSTGGVLGNTNAIVDPSNIRASTPVASPGIGVQVVLPEGY